MDSGPRVDARDRNDKIFSNYLRYFELSAEPPARRIIIAPVNKCGRVSWFLD